MKKLLVFMCALLVISLIGCSADTGVEEPLEVSPQQLPVTLVQEGSDAAWLGQEPETDVAEEPPVIQSSLPLDLAAVYFAMMAEILDEDDGALWGVNLNGLPFMFVDPLTRDVAANSPGSREAFTRQGEVYVGSLNHTQTIGTTAVRFGFEWWGMMTWDFLESAYDDDEIVRVMIHELFHAWQNELFEPPQPASGNIFEEDLDTNIHIRLEMNALLRALGGGSEEERRQSTLDALSIREERRQRHLGMTGNDIMTTIHEGTATYTDLMLGFSSTAARLAWIEDFKDAQTRGGIRRLSTYLIGAMYGFLLDEIGVNWKQGLRYETDLGVLLQDALGVTSLTPIDEIDLRVYGYAKITAIATEWHGDLERMARSAESAFFEQPTLGIEIMGGFSGEYDLITAQILGETKVALYGDIVFSGVFGQLTIHDGPMLITGYRIPVPGIVVEENRAFGHNWELELNEGFELHYTGNGYRIIRNATN